MKARRARRSAGRLASGLLLGAALLAAAPARPALVDVVWTLEVVAVDPGLVGITPGDRHVLAFTIDDAILDTNDFPGAGHFPGLVTSFAATADPSNTGSWNPDVGSYSAPSSNFVTNAFGGSVTLQFRGTGFPGAGFPFFDFDLRFGWPITDSGLGDSFATQLGVAPGALDLSDVPLFGSIRFQDGEDFLLATIAAPEPGSAAAGAAALLALALGSGLRAGGRASVPGISR